MAGPKEAVSFDEIIQAGRARNRNEQLANEIFGRNRKTKEANDRGNRSSSRTPSLASRVGVQKSQRSSSSSSSTAAQRPTPPSRTSSAVQAARVSRIQSALESPSSSQANISKSRGIAIKGAAGPFTVVATNFAPGTTAADIESAVANDGADADGSNALVSCRLTSTHRDPTVTAELVYSDRAVAEKIVSLYNNQRADGRILKLSIRSTSGKTSFKPAPPPTQPTAGAAAPDEDEEDIDMLLPDPAPDRYNSSRETEAAARARSKEHRRADPDRQDERYPIPSDSEPHVPTDGEDALQREDEAGRELSRSRSRNRDRERERDRDRERDSNRDRERERERERDRRDDQGDRRYEDRRDSDYDRSEPYPHDRDRRPYDNRPGWDPPRGGRSSHYGNGVGVPLPPAPRGGYGGYGGPGRGSLYAGPRGPRGGGGSMGYGRGGYAGRGW